MCAVAVHMCNNGSTTQTVCAPFSGGCQEPPPVENCADDEVRGTLINNGMLIEYDQYTMSLLTSDLYELRNYLSSTSKGDLFVKAYYNLSESFIETLTIPMILDIVVASPKIASFVKAMLSDDPSYVLSDTDFNLFVGILDNSVQNSTNIEYQEITNNLIAEAQVFENMNISQIKEELMFL